MSRGAVESWEVVTVSPEQTGAIGRAVGALAQPGDLVALVGELGAGKTQLVRGMAEGMGVPPAQVASPTFVMVHEYAAAPGRPVLVHIDAYRLHSLEDLESIGWNASGESDLRQGAVVAIEWADRLEGSLGQQVLEITLLHAGEGRRRLIFRSHGSQWAARLATLRGALDKISRDQA